MTPSEKLEWLYEYCGHFVVWKPVLHFGVSMVKNDKQGGEAAQSVQILQTDSRCCDSQFRAGRDRIEKTKYAHVRASETLARKFS